MKKITENFEPENLGSFKKKFCFDLLNPLIANKKKVVNDKSY